MTSPGNPAYLLSDSEILQAGEAADAVAIFRLVLYCSSRLKYRFDQHLREDDLTSQQGYLLSVVRARGQPTLGEVAKAMATSHQNVKQIAAVLSRKGMLRITTARDDARARRLTITPAGIKAWDTRDARDFPVLGSWMSGLSGAEQRRLRKLLTQLAEIV